MTDPFTLRPRYQSLLALLRRQSKRLRDVARLREDMFTPQPGQPFHYIEIGGLAADGAEAPSRATWIVQPGNVITSTGIGVKLEQCHI